MRFADRLRRLLPLSLSDVAMALGDPLQTAALTRLPDPTATLATMGVLKAVANLLESPIIMVLQTSTALAASARARAALARFVTLLAGGLTLLGLALTGARAYPWLMDVFGVTPSPDGRWALLLLAAWPATIAWRRYFQGCLIAWGGGSALGRAASLRLLAVGGVLSLGVALRLPGTLVGASAMLTGVLVEAAAVTAAARRQPPGGVENPGLPATVRGVAGFYLPLAGTMMAVWGGRAVMVALVGRSPDGELALAAWLGAWGLVTLVANSTRMVQQLAIADYPREGAAPLLRFGAVVGAGAGLALLGLGPPLLGVLWNGDAELLSAAGAVLRWGAIMPLLVALQNTLQGCFVASGRSWPLQAGTGVALVVGLGTCEGLLRAGLPGAGAATAAGLLGAAAEVATLALMLSAPARSAAPERHAAGDSGARPHAGRRPDDRPPRE